MEGRSPHEYLLQPVVPSALRTRSRPYLWEQEVLFLQDRWPSHRRAACLLHQELAAHLELVPGHLDRPRFPSG